MAKINVSTMMGPPVDFLIEVLLSHILSGFVHLFCRLISWQAKLLVCGEDRHGFARHLSTRGQIHRISTGQVDPSTQQCVCANL